MVLSVFDMLKIGVGPSSSHTLGPWKAARRWILELKKDNLLILTNRIEVYLFGSLALTGKGHATDKAIILGLLDQDPEVIEISEIDSMLQKVNSDSQIIFGSKSISFNPYRNIHFLKDQVLPFHSNGMKFKAIDNHDNVILESTYYSLGGGFISQENEPDISARHQPDLYCFTPEEMLQKCEAHQCSVSDIVFANEKSWLSENEIRNRLLEIWEVMKQAAFSGCHTEGILPGGLNVKRRAYEINQTLLRVNDYKDANGWIEAMKVGNDFSKVLTRISCLAIAVNEVNASMGRIVTAPTNGSAGVIPAVLFYYICFSGKQVSDDDICRFLLTAGEIGKYFKTGATISAAAGGCQAEIGVSSSMAAGALTECLGGSPGQVMMAAEIAAEHHLGLTCDPIGGLVQIPCIERNSMGAIKALTACMIALSSDPKATKVSLDNVIKTMKETAENMSSKYKETSLGGLAVNVGIPEC